MSVVVYFYQSTKKILSGRENIQEPRPNETVIYSMISLNDIMSVSLFPVREIASSNYHSCFWRVSEDDPFKNGFVSVESAKAYFAANKIYV